MKSFKSYYCSVYKSARKLTMLLIFCFFTACNQHNETKQILSTSKQIQVSENAVNINTATVAELEKLPHIGARKAQEIIEHREKFGRFRRAEYLMFVRGISDRRFREMKNLVKVE